MFEAIDRVAATVIRPGIGADGRVLLHCHAGCATRPVSTARAPRPIEGRSVSRWTVNGHEDLGAGLATAHLHDYTRWRPLPLRPGRRKSRLLEALAWLVAFRELEARAGLRAAPLSLARRDATATARLAVTLVLHRR